MITLFYPHNRATAWCVGGGLADALISLRLDEVRLVRDGLDPYFPSRERLMESRALIVSSPEHMTPVVLKNYPEWCLLPHKRVGWMHESVDHEGMDIDLTAIRMFTPTLFYPGYDVPPGMTYLPFSVDVRIFSHGLSNGPRDYPVAFIGTAYPKRQVILAEVSLYLKYPMTAGKCSVEDLAGFDLRASTELYAANLRKVDILFVPPSMSNLLVTKVFEGMSCGAIPAIPRDTPGADLIKEAAILYTTARDFAEQANALLGNSKQLRQMRRYGYELIDAKYNLQDTAQTLMEATWI